MEMLPVSSRCRHKCPSKKQTGIALMHLVTVSRLQAVCHTHCRPARKASPHGACSSLRSVWSQLQPQACRCSVQQCLWSVLTASLYHLVYCPAADLMRSCTIRLRKQSPHLTTYLVGRELFSFNVWVAWALGFCYHIDADQLRLALEELVEFQYPLLTGR